MVHIRPSPAFSTTQNLTIGSSFIKPCSAARGRLYFIDARRPDSADCLALRQLRSVRRQVPTDVVQSLVTALVPSGLDYGSSVLVGLPANLIRRL